MKNMTELFWQASVAELKQGYLQQGEEFICLICGKSFEQGMIYEAQGRFYEAEKYLKHHISKEHGSVFDYLLQMNKKYTGLTELQKSLLESFAQGLSDQEIVQALGGGSTSTIRNHRFSLREREKQARVFLAIMELLGGQTEQTSKLVEVHRTARMVDERFAITEAEREKFLKVYFKEGLAGPLEEFPSKEKRKIIILQHLITKFERERDYTEPEVNEILKQVYHDYVLLRRYLIEYGFMDRKDDGSLYWVKN